MKISIVMATYNGAGHLLEQLESFSKQTWLPSEVIICDDCSQDGTADLVQKFCDSAPFEVIFRKNTRNVGYVQNFVSGLAYASGEIIFFSDQDDVWLPEKIGRHLSVYESDSDVLAVISNQYIVGPNLEGFGRTSLDAIIASRGRDDDFVHGCCTSFRESMKRIACAPPVGFAHDDWVHAVANACGARRILAEPLQLYRRHDATTTRSNFNSYNSVIHSRRHGFESMKVARNLRRRQHAAMAIMEALRRDILIPRGLVQKGLASSCQDERYYSNRALRLETGGARAFLSSFGAIFMEKKRGKELLADTVRIALSIVTKFFRSDES